MYHISDDRAHSIKRVMRTDYYILTTGNYGLKLLAINDLEKNQFIIQDLLEVKDRGFNYTDSLQVFITPSQIVIAAVQNEYEEGNCKGSIKLMKVPIA